MKNKLEEEVVEFLKNHNTAVIATVSNNEPYASTIHYESDENMNIYFLSHRNTGKYLNISSNPKTAIVVGTGPKHISIQARGVCEVISGNVREEILEQFKVLKRSNLIENAPTDNMTIFEGKDYEVFKFVPGDMTFMNLDDSDYPESLGKDFHKII
jgi:uncharacterized pyridoxamine 5'-phosphate oxidase family protein